ncbi:MAG: hypothetical protein IJS08_19625 [Victivallales bacterium]|nr:hypothetical protein [Victivallales bacterium]
MASNILLEISQFMRQMDLTDMSRVEQLLDGYSSAAREYNALCERVRELLKNNMVEEAEHFLNELEPPLQQQYKELRQPAVREFLETAELYGLEAPSLEKPFEEIHSAMLNNVGLRPLIIRYRQVARSKNLQAKAELVRQILLLNPEDAQEWERNLISIEEEWKTQLQENAKQAILSGNYDLLKQIQETMLEEPWKTPFNEQVLSKVAQVLDEEDKRAKRRLCEQLIASSETMLSQPAKLKELAGALKKVDALLGEGIQLESPWQQRYETVSGQAQRLLTAAAEEERFASLFSELEQKMKVNAPVEQVDAIFYEMQRLRREIPEVTMRRVETYRQNAVIAAKRRRVMMLVVGVVVSVLLLGAGVVGFRAVSRSMSIKEYSTRLRTSIDNQVALSDEGYEILKEIEAKVPDIRNAKEIEKMAEELATKRRTEGERRVRFKELKQELSILLENYAENASSIVAKTKELQGVALQEHAQELETLMQIHDEKRAKYVRVQDTAYRKLVGEAGDAYIAMKTAMSEHRFDSARDFLPTIVEKLKVADEIPDVSGEAKGSLQALVEQYKHAEKTLDQAIRDNEVKKKLQEMETNANEFNQLVTSQKITEAEELYERIVEQDKEIRGEIKGASIMLRSQYDAMVEKTKDFDKQLSGLRRLIIEEDIELMKAFHASGLQNIQKELQAFQSKYPNFANSRQVEGLLKDLSTSLDETHMKEYDDELHARSKRLNDLLMDGVVVGIEKELQKKLMEIDKAPTYMLGFLGASGKKNDRLDLYLKKEVKFHKKMFKMPGQGDEYTISGINVWGMNEADDVKLVFGNNKRIFLRYKNVAGLEMILDYPGANAFSSDNFKYVGYWGEWLLSYDRHRRDYDFKQISSWRKLDQEMMSLFRKNSDGIRIVHEWLGIVDYLLSISPAFQKGGEFEMTELLELKKDLSSLMEVFPPEAKWYSASWEYPENSRDFYKKLQVFCDKQKQNCFETMMVRLNKMCGLDGTNLVPCGILAWCKQDGAYGWNFYPTGLPTVKGAYWWLFLADHDKKVSDKFGYYKVVNSDRKWEWHFDEGKEPKKGYYVTFIKK